MARKAIQPWPRLAPIIRNAREKARIKFAVKCIFLVDLISGLFYVLVIGSTDC